MRSKVLFTIAIICMISGPLFCVINNARGNGALNLSMEFRGGTATDVTFEKDYSIDEIDSSIKPIFQSVIDSAEIQSQKVSGANEIIFKTRQLSVDERQELTEALNEEFPIATYTDNKGEEALSINFETISSTISNEMSYHSGFLHAGIYLVPLLGRKIRFGGGSGSGARCASGVRLLRDHQDIHRQYLHSGYADYRRLFYQRYDRYIRPCA